MGGLMRLQVIEFNGLNADRTQLSFSNYEINLNQSNRLESTFSRKSLYITTTAN